MAHVVFAAPPIRRFHLHERLARILRARNHRVTLLVTDPVEFAFQAEQGMPVWKVRSGRARDLALPLFEFGEHECLRRGLRAPTMAQLERAAWSIDRCSGGLARFFEIDPPDLILFHGRRSGLHRHIHYLGRESGSQILWTGDGLLPNTLQWDDEGIDGDSSQCRLTLRNFRGKEEDPMLLAAALSAFVARSAPAPLTRELLRKPPFLTRLAAAVHSRCTGGERSLGAGLRAWREAAHPFPPMPRARSELPTSPFVAVLLQAPGDPRLNLDAPHSPTASELVRATVRAVRGWDPTMSVVAVLPAVGLPRGEITRIHRLEGARMELSSGLPEAVMTAVAVVTVNHPHGVGALLAGTPLLHTGRTPYGVRGIAHSTALDLLPRDLPAAASATPSALRGAFLTWLLCHGHLWCNGDHPDHNGVSGFVQEIEARLMSPVRTGAELRYRAGPAWPLAAESTV